MSPKAQQRIVITEACPDIAYVCKPNKWGNGGGQTFYVLGHPKANRWFDPVSDLNAMHEAEEILIKQGSYEWFKNHLKQQITEIVHATAAQRAEAFLRTLNLWKD